jgi:hypothetical protein
VALICSIFQIRHSSDTGEFLLQPPPLGRYFATSAAAKCQNCENEVQASGCLENDDQNQNYFSCSVAEIQGRSEFPPEASPRSRKSWAIRIDVTLSSPYALLAGGLHGE